MAARKGVHRETKPAGWAVAVAAGWIALSACAAVAASDPIIYPAKGQSTEQVEKDKYECYQWAKGQTGFDPMQAQAPSAPPPQEKGGAVKGAAGGALAGLAIGAAAGDAKKGAAIGAVSGGVVGGARQANRNQAAQQQAQQKSAGYEQRRAEYNRAWGACMEGRGYTIR